MTRDFTLSKYRELCEVFILSRYNAITVEEYVLGHAAEPLIILRHDVDRNPEMTLQMAEIERDMGIRTTYYFRMMPGVFEPGIIKILKGMGHEIGYHYEVLDKAKGDMEKAIVLFERELEMFRKILDVRTICMHGNPLAKWSNRDLWQEYDFSDFGIIGDAYLSIDYSKVLYLSDTGRNWKNNFSIKDIVPYSFGEIINSTDDIIKISETKKYQEMCILVHSNRWTDDYVLWIKELLWQNIKNIGKTVIKEIS